jgi:hypothetical protein
MPHRNTKKREPKGQWNELRGMSVIELRNTKYALPLRWPWLFNPRAGAVCLAVHVTGNLLAPAGLYPSVGLRFCSSWQGNWKWSARAASIAGSPGDPLCLGCDDLLHNKVNVLFHLELTVPFVKKRTEQVFRATVPEHE